MEKITNLKKLKLSPKVNPLIESSTPIKTKNGLVATKMGNDLLDPETGEQHTHALIHTIKTIDDANFVKVFAEGVKKAFELNRTEMRVFQKVLEIYEKEKMTGGYADSITLCWFDDGLNGEKIGMSDRTFQNGLKGLLNKGFLSPKLRDQFWVNPSLFFKGDRVAFITEYKRTNKTEQNKLEDAVQQRLID
ncbi:Mobile element protein [uncultured Gammaproteobacteria bacterium]|nr:Mobile element protein [uncultured Gammaproteobacteria bacterium]